MNVLGILGGEEARQYPEPGFTKNVDTLNQKAGFIETQSRTYHESVT